MKNFLVYSLCLFILMTLISCEQKTKTTYPDGSIYEEYTTNDEGAKEGEYKRYYENGSIAEISVYKNDILNGKRKFFFANGNLEQEEDWINNKLTGKKVVYYDTGEKYVEAEYDSSMIVGVFKKFYKNGQVQEEVTFEKDLENGPFTEYYESGAIKWKGQYLNGDNEFGIIENYDEQGSLIKKLECDSMKICKTIWHRDSLNIAQ